MIWQIENALNTWNKDSSTEYACVMWLCQTVAETDFVIAGMVVWRGQVAWNTDSILAILSTVEINHLYRRFPHTQTQLPTYTLQTHSTHRQMHVRNGILIHCYSSENLTDTYSKCTSSGSCHLSTHHVARTSFPRKGQGLIEVSVYNRKSQVKN